MGTKGRFQVAAAPNNSQSRNPGASRRGLPTGILPRRATGGPNVMRCSTRPLGQPPAQGVKTWATALVGTFECFGRPAIPAATDDPRTGPGRRLAGNMGFVSPDAMSFSLYYCVCFGWDGRVRDQFERNYRQLSNCPKGPPGVAVVSGPTARSWEGPERRNSTTRTTSPLH